MKIPNRRLLQWRRSFLIVLFLIPLLSGVLKAQQLAPLDHTRDDHVLANRNEWAKTFFALPHGAHPFFPATIPDSLKCGALFNKTTSGQPDTLKQYDCSTSSWVNVGSGASGSFLPLTFPSNQTLNFGTHSLTAGKGTSQFLFNVNTLTSDGGAALAYIKAQDSTGANIDFQLVGKRLTINGGPARYSAAHDDSLDVHDLDLVNAGYLRSHSGHNIYNHDGTQTDAVRTDSLGANYLQFIGNDGTHTSIHTLGPDEAQFDIETSSASGTLQVSDVSSSLTNGTKPNGNSASVITSSVNGGFIDIYYQKGATGSLQSGIYIDSTRMGISDQFNHFGLTGDELFHISGDPNQYVQFGNLPTSGNTIYTGDGTLADNRAVDIADHELDIGVGNATLSLFDNSTDIGIDQSIHGFDGNRAFMNLDASTTGFTGATIGMIFPTNLRQEINWGDPTKPYIEVRDDVDSIGFVAHSSIDTGKMTLNGRAYVISDWVKGYVAAHGGGGGTTNNAVTFNNSGSGASSGTAFDGSAARTISYNTVGAQPLLVSGTNIKSINSSSILASGNLNLQTPLTAGTDYEVPLTFTSGVSRTSNTVKADTSILAPKAYVNNFLTKALAASTYQTALGFTPVTNARTISINGVSQDLSANRTYTITTANTDTTGTGFAPKAYVNNFASKAFTGTTYLGKSNNLSALTNIPLSRSTLGLGYSTPYQVRNNYLAAWWGDSLTAGQEGWSIPAPSLFATRSGFNVFNGGINGQTSTLILARLTADTARQHYATIINWGRNDLGDTTTLKANWNTFKTLMTTLSNNRYAVVGIIKQRLSTEYTGTTTATTIDRMNAYASALFGSHFVDIEPILVAAYNPAIPQDVVDHGHGVPPFSLHAVNDSLHLNTAGYQIVANNIPISQLLDTTVVVSNQTVRGVTQNNTHYDVANNGEYDIAGAQMLWIPNQETFTGTAYVANLTNTPRVLSHSSGVQGQEDLFGGWMSGNAATTAFAVTTWGAQSGQMVTSGSSLVLLGTLAGVNATSATGITAVGTSAGGGITTGSNDLILGNGMNGLSSTLSNRIILGVNGVQSINITGNATPSANQVLRTGDSGGAADFGALDAADIPALANLTATDATLTFSGTYNTTTARTIGLNLSNANTWVASQTFGTAIASSLNAVQIGNSATNLWQGNSITSTSSTTAIDLIGGASTVYAREFLGNGQTNTTMVTAGSASTVEVAQAPITTFSSGTSAIIAGLSVRPPAITISGTAVVTDAATTYSQGVPNAGSNKWNLWAKYGNSRVSGLQVDTLTASSGIATNASKQLVSEPTGQTTLVSGTKAISISGLTTSSKAFITLVSQGGTTATTSDYEAVCTSGTLTINAVTSAGTNTVNASDTSVINYRVIP